MGKLLAAGALSRKPTEPNGDRSTDPSTNGEETITRDDVHHLLSNRRRRDVLRYLETVDSSTTVGDLAVHIAADENEIPIPEVTSEQRKRVYISLYQAHLPKLDAEGVIDYDRDRGRIELAGEADELVEYLDDGSQASDNWSSYYLALACLTLGVVGLMWLGVAPIATVPGTGFAAVVGLLLLGLSVVHRYSATDT